MARSNPVKEKSYAFALQVVAVVREMQKQREYVLSNQLLRAGTSIGANVEEAGAAQSRRDFAAKMAIASKEARETDYWLRLLLDSRTLSEERGHGLRGSCLELIRLLTAIVKSAQSPIKH